jgi:hypothetical protein
VFSFFGWSKVRLSPLIGLLYQPRMIDDDDDDDACRAVSGMRNCQENRSTRRKPGPVPLCPPGLGSNSGRRCGKPATKRLSYDAACVWLGR